MRHRMAQWGLPCLAHRNHARALLVPVAPQPQQHLKEGRMGWVRIERSIEMTGDPFDRFNLLTPRTLHRLRVFRWTLWTW